MDRRREADPRFVQGGESGSPVEPERGEVDLHEIGLDPFEVDRDARFRQGLRQPSRTSVVVGKPLEVVVERIDAGCGDDPGLAHGAAEEVLLAPGALDQLVRAGEERAERTAKALGEAERDGVEARREGRGLDTQGGGRVQESRAVQVQRQPELARGRDDGCQLVERPDPSPGVVVGVLQREHRCSLVGDLRARSRRRADLLRRDSPVRPGQAEAHQTRVRGCTAVLVDKNVRRLLGQQHVPRPAVQLERDLVRHRRRRHEQRGFLAEQLRDAALELVDGRVLALLLVSDRGIGDRPSHSGCGPRDGVGPEIDHARAETLPSGDGSRAPRSCPFRSR